MTKDEIQAAHGWIDDVMFYAVSGGIEDTEGFKKRSRAPIQTIRAALLFTASTFIDNENIKASDEQVDPVNVSAPQVKAETVDRDGLKDDARSYVAVLGNYNETQMSWTIDYLTKNYNFTRKTK